MVREFEKPDIVRFRTLSNVLLQRYERYLPTAFDESMSMLEKVNKVIEFLETVVRHLNEQSEDLEAWEEELLENLDLTLDSYVAELERIKKEYEDFRQLILDEILPDSVRNKLEEWLNDGTLDHIINDYIFNDINNDIKNIYTHFEYWKPFNIPNAQYNYETKTLTGENASPSIQQYLDWCKENKKKAIFPSGDFRISTAVEIPPGISIEGTSQASDTTNNEISEESQDFTRFYFDNDGTFKEHSNRELYRGMYGTITGISFINVSENIDQILLNLDKMKSMFIHGNSFTSYVRGMGTGIKLSRDGSFILIQRNRILYLNNGISFEGTGAEETADANTITDNDITLNVKGISMTGTNNGNVITNNNISLNTEYDIYLYRGHNNFVNNNRIESAATLNPILLGALTWDNKVHDNMITHKDPNKEMIKETTGGYGTNSINRQYSGFYRQSYNNLISYEKQITGNSPTNHFSNSRFPHLSEWLYNVEGLEYSGQTEGSEGVLIVKNNSAEDKDLIFNIHSSFNEKFLNKPVTFGAYIHSTNQTDTTVSITWGQQQNTLTRELINDYELFVVSGNRQGSPPSFVRIKVKAGQLLKIKRPSFYIGNVYYNEHHDLYDIDKDRRTYKWLLDDLPNEYIGVQKFDQTVNKPVWYKGNGEWVDALGDVH